MKDNYVDAVYSFVFLQAANFKLKSILDKKLSPIFKFFCANQSNLVTKYFLITTCFLTFIQKPFSQIKTEKSVSLSVSLMKGLPRPKNVPRGQSLDPDIKLVILNNTDTTATFYQTWNIWGDNAIRLELTIQDSVFTLYYASFCSSNNYPAANILQPGDSMVVYLKIEECSQSGPCPCVYSLPNKYRFPSSNLRGAKLRVFYKMDLENHQQAVDIDIGQAKLFDSLEHKRGKLIKKQEKYLKSFVTSELISKPIEIDFDLW